MSTDLAAHKLDLARGLLDDIELSRLAPEQLLLKATRLARLLDAKDVQKWLRFELEGYPGDDPLALHYMGRTGRWTDHARKLGYWLPLAQLEGHIAATRLAIENLKVPSVNFAPSSANPNEWVTGFGGHYVQAATQPVADAMKKLDELRGQMATLTGVRSRVMSVLHGFVSSAYYELTFSGLAAGVFDAYKAQVDELLRLTAADALEKVPAISERLAAGDGEAVSHALNTVRRVLDAFADAVYPPQSGKVIVGGKELEVGADKTVNRIEAPCTRVADDRRERLLKTFRLLRSRASAGVHAEVTPDEGRALFLQTYLVLGEMLLLRSSSPPSNAGDG
jgi:hypothetical protein